MFEQNTETMASVMATIANNGVHHPPYVVQKVVGPDGTVVFDQNDPGSVAFSPEVAACEQNILRGVVTGGTGGNAAVDGHTVYGKTGTTDARNDAWFIGATPQTRDRGVVRQLADDAVGCVGRVRRRLRGARCSAPS